MGVKEGWQGRFFEDFEIGDVYQHPLGRTVSEADNTWFTLLTMNTNQMHFNSEYAKKTRVRQAAGRLHLHRRHRASGRASPTSPRTPSPTSAGTRSG